MSRTSCATITFGKSFSICAETAQLLHCLLILDFDKNVFFLRFFFRSCRRCFAVFHLRCLRKWASAVTKPEEGGAENGPWRCPGCQDEHPTKKDIGEYRCFCGKRKVPDLEPGITPHSCGEPCGRNRGENRYSRNKTLF